MELDIEDKDSLQEILILMYPEVPDFKNRKPTAYTMEVFLQTLKASTFCNNLMTELTVGLVTGPAGRLYRGPMKPLVKKILKEVRKHYTEKTLKFMLCEKVLKLKSRWALQSSLEL
ncbi:hypothetical protein [Neptunomonas phycophila]|uniref:hypothetical protein n=1 Tax=Neptunomonas phycophila TaxID=1572645 RepID=UPI0035164B77